MSYRDESSIRATNSVSGLKGVQVSSIHPEFGHPVNCMSSIYPCSLKHTWLLSMCWKGSWLAKSSVLSKSALISSLKHAEQVRDSVSVLRKIVEDCWAQQPIKLHPSLPRSWSTVLIGWDCVWFRLSNSQNLCVELETLPLENTTVQTCSQLLRQGTLRHRLMTIPHKDK